jgi:ABC-type glycerol-3-phosphate transport system substrate-binding protein
MRRDAPTEKKEALPMRNRRITLGAATIAALSIVIAVSACASGTSTEGAQKITVGVEAGSPWETFYGEAAAEFTEQTGISVEFTSIPHANMREQFLSDAVSGAGGFDVFTVDQPWLPEFAQNGYLVNLDDRLSEDTRADFLPHSLDTTSFEGSLYGIPYMVHNTVLYYRTDLFEAAGIDAPPTTWEEYRADARLLTNTDTGVWGTVIPGKQDGEVATRFESFVLAAGGDIADGAGAPTIDTPEARAAFDMMTAIQFDDQSSPPGLNDLTVMQGQFLEGNAAMIIIWPYLYSIASDETQSKVAGNFDIAQVPGDPQSSTTFSWGFGINSSSKNIDASWQWLEWSTSPAILERLSRSQVAPVPLVSVNEALAAATDLTDEQRHAFQVFGNSVAASTTMPMTPVYPQYQEAIAVLVSAVMSKSMSVDDALAQAQQTMEAAYADTLK